ncbi:MAG: hypothetical protein NVSMB65_10530 [Chloroflexota bacterium]
MSASSRALQRLPDLTRAATERLTASAPPRPTRARTASYVTVGLVTLVVAFGIQAAVDYWLLQRHTALVLHYRGTLEYRSAVIGDGMLMPLINMLIASALLDWRKSIRLRSFLPAMGLSACVTGTVHWYQASRGLINWTMPRPYAWTAMGYYHAAFMFAELTLIAYFLAHTLWKLRTEGLAGVSSRRVGLILLGLGLFADLLMRDYF